MFPIVLYYLPIWFDALFRGDNIGLTVWALIRALTVHTSVLLYFCFLLCLSCWQHYNRCVFNLQETFYSLEAMQRCHRHYRNSEQAIYLKHIFNYITHLDLDLLSSKPKNAAFLAICTVWKKYLDTWALTCPRQMFRVL